MIHRIVQQQADLKILAGKEVPIGSSNKIKADFSDVIVKKPWGYEYLVFENEFVAIWLLQLVRTRKTSMHCHPRKRTGLILLSGQAIFRHLEGEIGLGALDGVVIEKGTFHSTEASSHLPISPVSENGIWVMEIESPPQKDDLVRLKDEYGRAGASYEGKDNMVFEPQECLKLEAPENGISRKDFFDCTFTIMQGSKLGSGYVPGPQALISVIGRGPGAVSKNTHLEIGGVSTFQEFQKNTMGENLSGYTLLAAEKILTTVKVSDYVADFIADLGVTDVFSVSGGGAMHLVDSFGNHPRIRFIATHHEQAASYAAEGYARISGKPGVAVVTTGPGGTNTISGVYGAWIDSIPTIFIAGQVPRHQMINETGLRQYGVQESDMVTLVKPITKYAVVVDDPAMIKFHLQKALHLATTGRPGPVWLDIPLDIQSKLVNPADIAGFVADAGEMRNINFPQPSEVEQCLHMLQQAERPVLISGYGIRLSGGEKEYLRLVDKLKIPVVSSWTSTDLLPYDDDNFIGRSGIFGDRGANFAVQNCDLLLVIGSRLSVPQMGYNHKAFARAAKKIVVDIDRAELTKPSLTPDLPIQADAREFMSDLLDLMEKRKAESLSITPWRERCHDWRKRYPVVLPEYKDTKGHVNSFYFIDVLSNKLDKTAVICTDMGTSFTCTMQTFKIKMGQRLFTSSGHAPMGFGLPGTIGACCANNRQKTICISGDGGLQMNIQELQTLVHYKLPIILFVLNNGGYLTIKLMQQNHFGRYAGAESTSGVSCPDIIKLGRAYGIESERIHNHDELHARMDSILAHPGPFICEIMMSETQPLIPRVSSIKKPDGSIVSQPLENLFPFLDKKEFDENMIVKPMESLNQ